MRPPLSTTRNASVGFPEIHLFDRHVAAEVKQLRLHRDRTLANPAIMRRDQTLIVFAACYAGRGDLDKAGRRAERMGRDASARFGDVELAMVKAVGREPAVRVRDILKCRVTCRLAEDRRLAGR